MTQTVLILGATGKFGIHATRAFAAAGWSVFAQSRTAKSIGDGMNVTTVTGELLDDPVVQAAAQADVIVNAAHPPYTDWARELPKITQAAIQLAHGKTMISAGNVYNFGSHMPPILDSDTPQTADTRKGKMRVTLENTLRDAAGTDMQCIILRGGDYLQDQNRGNWFDGHMVTNLAKGDFMYPGPMDQVHAWAFLPDFARAIVELANIRNTLNTFEDIGFEGYSITGRDMHHALETLLKRPLRLKSMPWWLMPLVGIFNPVAKEIIEIKYLWDRPHQISPTRFDQILPEFQHTDLIPALDHATQAFLPPKS